MTTREETSVATEAPAVRAVTAPARPEIAVRPATIRPVEPEPAGPGPSVPGVFETGTAPSETVPSDRQVQPVRHRHLAVFAVTIPAAGAAGFVAAIVDATVTALVLTAVVIGGFAARWLLPRLFAWAASALAFITGRSPK
ncbi:MAG TPA: hypothetical protein VK046_10035 [Actinomycetaceae bacterium]|nr:hypothetical protein [Actinomycetaceae bacterium]